LKGLISLINIAKNMEMKAFKKEIEVRWSDVDQNHHVRHSAYYDYGAYARVRMMAEAGFGTDELMRLQIGPVLFKEECTFMREIKPDDTITVNVLRDKSMTDRAKWKLHHEIFNSKGDKVAHITVLGGWLNTKERKLTLPPEKLADEMEQLAIGEDYIHQKKK
jgi:acyl-CoA thioester hydrolase